MKHSSSCRKTIFKSHLLRCHLGKPADLTGMTVQCIVLLQLADQRKIILQICHHIEFLCRCLLHFLLRLMYGKKL